MTSQPTTITDDQITQLQIEAGAAGDIETVALCDRALAGDPSARLRALDIIIAARAMED